MNIDKKQLVVYNVNVCTKQIIEAEASLISYMRNYSTEMYVQKAYGFLEEKSELNAFCHAYRCFFAFKCNR